MKEAKKKKKKKNVYPKGPENIYYQAYVYNSIAFLIELNSLFVFTVIFYFLMSLLITLFLGDSYKCGSMKVQK